MIKKPIKSPIIHLMSSDFIITDCDSKRQMGGIHCVMLYLCLASLINIIIMIHKSQIWGK